MDEGAHGTAVPIAESDSHSLDAVKVERGAESGGNLQDGLTEAQKEVLERCLHALNHAKNDSHTLAALLLITRLCPANQLDKPTLRRIFEAVGLSLPARLLVTAMRGSESPGLPPDELLSLGTALLAALTTDPDMASHPQLLATVPLLLRITADGGPTWNTGNHDTSTAQSNSPSLKLDKIMAADCYQVLTAVCALPRGPDQLLTRGVIPALCRALHQDQTFSHDRGLSLLGSLLSGNRVKAWNKHPAELLSLLIRVSKDFGHAKNQARLDMCTQILQFLPPPGAVPVNEELKGVVASLWGSLRPMMQSKLTPRQIGPILVLSACLLDLYGWEPVGPPKFCCLLVNRACVEVRMGLEEPPGTDLSVELQHTLTACYRIMEAAMEQACNQGTLESAAPSESVVSGLSLQQSRQVLMVLEEAFAAIIYYLTQVDRSRFGDPFVFATFRSLCSWLAEETSCLREEVIGLLPFLIVYTRSHLQEASLEQGLSNWMSAVSVNKEGGTWTGEEALRYFLPALCHLSAEEGPRKVLLTLDTPALLVEYLLQAWSSLKVKGGAVSARDPSMETACSALLNFTVTEPERVRKDSCFRTLESFLSDALPVLVHKPRLLVLAANYCTLGLMIGRLKPAPDGDPVEAGQRRFFSAALRFLCSALDPGSGPGPVRVSSTWLEWWEEAGELWRLGLQALGGCVRAQPCITALIREEGWLTNTLSIVGICDMLPDTHTRDALEEALCAIAEQCPLCKQEIGNAMKGHDKGALRCMGKLRKALGVK